MRCADIGDEDIESRQADVESVKKKLYENMQDMKPKGLVGWFFTRLRKFETNRVSAVLGLLPSGEKLLDVGCGEGSLVTKAKEKFKEVHGIDLSASRIEKAKANADERFPNSKQMYFSLADIDNGIPYADSVFDVVTCLAVLEHVFNPYYVIREVNRVLITGGTLIVEVPNVAWLPRRLSLLFGKLPVTSNAENDWEVGHLHYFTMFSLCKLFKDAGFKVFLKTGSGIFSKLRDWWPSLLTGDLIIKGIKLRRYGQLDFNLRNPHNLGQ